MDTILEARVALPHPSPSPWRNAKGCSWRLCANRSRPNIVSLSLNLLRHSTHSAAYLSVLAETPDTALQPVQNLYVSQLSARHPCDLTFHFMSGEASKSIQLPQICFPPGQQNLTLKIHISMEAQPTSPTAIQETPFQSSSEWSPWSRGFSCPVRCPTSFRASRERCRRFTHRCISSNPNSITWLGEEHDEQPPPPLRPDLVVYGTKDVRSKAKHSHITIPSIGRVHSTHFETRRLVLGRELHLPNAKGVQQGKSPGNHSDITLVILQDDGEDVEFHLHRRVLAQASPVFQAMLSCSMLENLSGRVELSSFDPSTITLAVRHMYGERIDGLIDLQGFDLYRFGHQFEVLGLSDLSRHHILTNMNCATCIDILNFGFFFDDVKLKEHSSAFITEHFSEIASEDHTLANICSLPPKVFFSFIESDSLCATELETFFVSMKWLSCNESAASVMDIVRRIRWNLMQPDMFQTALNSPMVLRFPSLRKFLRSSRMTISMHLNGNTPHIRRMFGRPTAIVSIPIVQQPPQAALRIAHNTSDDMLGAQEYRSKYKRNRVSNMVDKLFQYQGLGWSFRAELGECQAKGCSQPRLSVSLWLEQNESGFVSIDELRTDGVLDSFPIRVKSKYLVWNSMGGQLHKGIVDFTFRSSGWASGWCVQDVLGGHKQSDVFFQKLSSLKGTTDVVHVAIEILNCEKG